MTLTKVDIANRALQRIGAERITAFTDDSKNASEVNACYDRLRQAELRRNPWRFAIRKNALRPITTTTQILTFATWSAIVTYAVGDVVTGSDGAIYQGTVATNLNHDPVSSTGYWSLYFGPDSADTHDSTLSYYAGEIVKHTTFYLSLISGNTDPPPSSNWLALTAQPTAITLQFLYPIGSGPFHDTSTDNVFRLPVGWLCEVPQDPTQPSWARDWLYESNYLISGDAGPLIYRYVADMVDVNKMDAMFIEGLGARIAFELCEALTQSITKLGAIGKEYQQFMSEARTRSAIETGPVAPEEDSWVSVKTTGAYSPFGYV